MVPGTPNFQSLALDQTGTFVGSVFTFDEGIPAGIAVGDYLCTAGETPIPQMPTEIHTVLAQRVAEKLTENGSPRLPAIQAGLKQARDDATVLLSPRSDGSIRPIVSRYGAGSRAWWW